MSTDGDTPPDITLSCDLTFFLEFPETAESESVELGTVADWCGAVRANWHIDRVCRVDSVELADCRRTGNGTAEIDVHLLLTMLGEDESPASLCARIDDGWGDLTPDLPGLPSDWSASLAGVSTPVTDLP